MTTNDIAAAMASIRTVSRAPARVAAAVCATALMLAGCSSGASIGNNNDAPQSTVLAPPQQTAPAPAQSAVRVAVAPVIGPPEAVAKALVTQLNDASERQRVSIARTPGDSATYTLRGYFVAPAKDKAGSKLSYIWDVTDAAGKRVNRITGEEAITPSAGDPWAAMTPTVIQSIADKTATSLAAWLPTQSSSGAVPVAGAAAPANVASAPPVSSNTTTGSISGAILAVSPKVVGAPGDGNTSLASAMRRELEEKGVQFSEAGQSVYRVSADVKIKPPKDGMQSISINWIVNDPRGGEVAKITQNNDVPAGYLDKSWGQSADDAAKAASVQIKQVIADHRSGRQIQSSAGPSGKTKVN